MSETQPNLPAVLIVMGVSGSGKTTIAALLAGRLGWEFEDGDDFHPPANVAKMHGGTPLTDEDRWPWLNTMAAWIDATRRAGKHGILACSALKRAYRDVLVGTRPDVRVVYLKGSKELIATRQAARLNHFMPATLVDSQFATLEEPGEDERPITVSVEPRPQEVVRDIVAALEHPPKPDQNALKRQAAAAAVAEVRDGMVLGLGTGSTAAMAVELLGERVKDGLDVVGIPTSERTAEQARSLGIKLTTLAEHGSIDLTIDGADEVHTGTLELIKGLGGALLREKIVAAASRRMTVIVDESKLVPKLGGVRLPVEVVAFGVEATLRHLRDAGADPVIRRGGDAPFRTDGGNLIADCSFADGIGDAAALHARLKGIVGVVETGLFIGMASRVIAGTASGPRILERA